jgi:hypothetical protein
MRRVNAEVAVDAEKKAHGALCVLGVRIFV